jgi:hypothetical protein
MAIQTHRRPDLREAICNLCTQLVPAVRDGGAVPLTTLVEAVAGAALAPEVRRKLDSRRDAVFARADGHTRFHNEGPEVRIALRKFDIQVPRRIAGHAHLAGDGAVLRFERGETLSAVKYFFSVKLEGIELGTKRVFVDMEGDSFDQCFVLA